MEGFRYIGDVTTLDLDIKLCTGCGMCIRVCPHHVFGLNGSFARIVDRDACMECGACARNCPAEAISVDAGVGCATGLINEWLREKRFRRSRGGCCEC
jgi:NAD-dependent dihydropyrimidine dehydrogenase PreA subunit